MKGYLFLNGDPPAKMPATDDGITVCADGAYEYVSRHIRPDAVLGDFDSLNLSEVPAGIKTVRFPSHKDYTDGHLAVEYMSKARCSSIEIYGAFGGRPDHELCNYSLLAYAHELGMKAVIKGDSFDVLLIDGEFTGTARKDATVSLVPFDSRIHILYTKGLKYAAKALTVDRIHIISVSNGAVGGEFSVSVNGLTLLFVER